MPISSALGSSALLPAGLGFRNVVINGDMAIDQRNSGSAVTSASASYVWPVDRFKFYQAAGNKITGQRVAKSALSSNAPEGFQYSLKLTNAASGTTPGASDEYELYHIVEGSTLGSWDWGYSTAKPVVLSFWVRSSVTGIYSVSLYNAGANNRSYVTNYTINAANTWEKKTIQINGDITGTWTVGASSGIGIVWDLGSGSNYNTTPNVWLGAFDTKTSDSTMWISTANATFYITGVQFEQNYQATPFEQRPYGIELELCKRYYQQERWALEAGPLVSNLGFAWSNNSYKWVNVTFATEMRTAPTVTTESGAGAGFDGKARYLTSNGSGGGVDLTPYGFNIKSTSFTLKSYNEANAYTHYGLNAGYKAEAEL